MRVRAVWNGTVLAGSEARRVRNRVAFAPDIEVVELSEDRDGL